MARSLRDRDDHRPLALTMGTEAASGAPWTDGHEKMLTDDPELLPPLAKATERPVGKHSRTPHRFSGPARRWPSHECPASSPS